MVKKKKDAKKKGAVTDCLDLVYVGDEAKKQNKKKQGSLRRLFSSNKSIGEVSEITTDRIGKSKVSTSYQEQEAASRQAARALLGEIAEQSAREFRWKTEVQKIAAESRQEQQAARINEQSAASKEEEDSDTLVSAASAGEPGGATLAETIQELQQDAGGVFLDRDLGMLGMLEEFHQSAPAATEYLTNLLASLSVMTGGSRRIRTNETQDAQMDLSQEDLGPSAFFQDLKDQVSELPSFQTLCEA